MAQTLLAIPAMSEAIRFIEGWIGKQGPGLERLGMLAWAKGCVSEYDRAEALWNEFLAVAPGAPPEELATVGLLVCQSLVDCFASAGEMERAARVARAGWQACRDLAAFPHQYGDPPERRTDANWLHIFHQAGLPIDDVAHQLLENLGPDAKRDLLAQGVALSIRAWIDDADALTADWLAWAKACVQAGDWSHLPWIQYQTTGALRGAGRPDGLIAWASAVRRWLTTVPGEDASQLYKGMRWSQYNGWAYLEAGDLDGAERVARQAIEEAGDYVVAGCFLVEVAIRRGRPTPPDVLQFIEENGIEAIDEYGMTGWYVTAREATTAGDLDKAFAALERAINYWSNPPFVFDRQWEQDAYWGDLRQHPEYKRIYREKRERIGPIYGELHYFPGW